MSAMQRTKGQQGERELARLLSDLTGKTIRRRVRQHDGDSDLIGLPGWSIECKRYARATPALLAQWWLQAVRQAEAEDTTPLLCWRADRMRDWTFVWPASLHCLDAPRYPADVKDTLSADPLIWWRMVRRWT